MISDKATEELAKLGGRSLDTIDKAGGWLEEVFGQGFRLAALCARHHLSRLRFGVSLTSLITELLSAAMPRCEPTRWTGPQKATALTSYSNTLLAGPAGPAGTLVARVGMQGSKG
jgi:hypothetical protein